MISFQYQIMAAALFALPACDVDLWQSEKVAEIVRFEPGMKLGEMVSRRFYEEHLAPQIRADREPYVATIGVPHTVRMKVGSEEIELHPGGYNSVTYIHSGYSPGGIGDGANRDYSRIGQLSTDTGSRRMTRKAARDLAISLCTAAEKGLDSKSNLNTAQAIDKIISSTDDNLKRIGQRAGDVCVVENSSTMFLIRYYGPDEIPSKDEEAFRLDVTLGEAMK